MNQEHNIIRQALSIFAFRSHAGRIDLSTSRGRHMCRATGYDDRTQPQ